MAVNWAKQEASSEYKYSFTTTSLNVRKELLAQNIVIIELRLSATGTPLLF